MMNTMMTTVMIKLMMKTTRWFKRQWRKKKP